MFKTTLLNLTMSLLGDILCVEQECIIKRMAFLMFAYSYSRVIYTCLVNLHMPVYPIGRIDFLLTALSNAFWIVF